MKKLKYLILALCLSIITSQSQDRSKFLNGTLVVLNKSEATVTLISLETGKPVAVLGTGIGPHEVAVSPDGKTAVVCNYGERPLSTLTVINIERKRPLNTIHLGEYQAPHGIEFLPDGEHIIATVERNRAVILVNIKEGVVEKVIPTGDLSCHMIAITPDGKRGFAASIGSGAVSVLDIEKGEEIKSILTGKGAEGVAVTPDGMEAWVTNREADTICVIDTSTLEIIKTIPSASFPIRIKFTPDGKYALVSNARTGDVAVFDTEHKKELRRISMEVKAEEGLDGRMFNQFGTSPTPMGIVISPDGSHAFISNTRAGIVTVVDLKTWKIKSRLIAGKEPDGMAYSRLSLK
ncbi:MAG: YncE family protein [Candidatus Aminicenantes bacterium]|nr:YncE family protein [Candidatus Aminicenantes bacterium]